VKFLHCILWIILPLSAGALTINGLPYLEANEVAGRLGMKTSWIERGKRIRLESQWTRMEFELNKREMVLNGTPVHLGFPVAEHRGRLCISESDYSNQIQPILTPQLNGNPPGLRRIVIDPGHGGKDPGAQNPSLGLREKALTLDLAKRLQRLLQANGFEVSLTRSDDTFIELDERSAIANRRGADLFVSIHFNALERSSVSGVETYAFTPFKQPSSARADLHESDLRNYAGQQDGPWSTLLAYYVQRSLADSLGSSDRGLKRARFTVLRDLRMPGILVEGGFVTHPREGSNIGSAAYRDKMARALTEGILLYQKTLSRLEGTAAR